MPVISRHFAQCKKNAELYAYCRVVCSLPSFMLIAEFYVIFWNFARNAKKKCRLPSFMPTRSSLVFRVFKILKSRADSEK